VKTGTPGIAFFGYVFAPTGYGTAARSYIHALRAASVNLSVINRSRYPQQFVPDALVSSLLNREIRPDWFLSHTEPNDTKCLQEVLPRTILLTTWEANVLPGRYIENLNRMREIWVPCRYNLEAFRQQLKTPVFQLPHPVRASGFNAIDRAATSRKLGVGESDFVFLSVASWQSRKNLPLLVEAFVRAFAADRRVKLVIKTSYDFTSKQEVVAQIARAIGRAHPACAFPVEERIRLYAGIWPEEPMAALMQRADCYVSLHSGEGWCYPLFDAASNGTPVVATGYSGPLDYLDREHHHLVRYELTPVDPRQQPRNFPFTSEMLWALPDLLHAVELMREVYENRERAAEEAKAGAAQLRERYSIEAVGGMARERLAALMGAAAA
jgi:glycosyltransferase involved in cell wall biosynthesis